jgi:hypothetical protein
MYFLGWSVRKFDFRWFLYWEYGPCFILDSIMYISKKRSFSKFHPWASWIATNGRLRHTLHVDAWWTTWSADLVVLFLCSHFSTHCWVVQCLLWSSVSTQSVPASKEKHFWWPSLALKYSWRAATSSIVLLVWTVYIGLLDRWIDLLAGRLHLWWDWLENYRGPDILG